MSVPRGMRLIKNSMFNILNALFTIGETIIISIWVARQLGPFNYGIFSNVLWVTSSFTWIIGLGFSHVVTRFVAEFQGRGEKSYCKAIILFVLKVELVFAVLITSILLFFHAQIADYFFSANEAPYYFIAFLGLIPGMTTAIFSSAIEGIQKFEYFTIANLIITPLSFLGKVVVLTMGLGINGLLYVMLIFSFINTIFYGLILFREGTLSFFGVPLLEKVDRKRMLGYNNSIIPILLCDKIVWDKSENFFLGRFCKDVEIAFFNLGFNVAQRFTSILPDTFWRVLFPAMSQRFGSGDRKGMERLFFISSRYLAFFSFPVGVAGIILAYQLINFLYGHQYIGAQRSLQIIFFSSIFASLSKPASAILFGYGKQAFIYKFGAILAILNISLDLWLIKPYGANGAAICYGITTLLGSIGGLIYTCHAMKLNYPFVSLFKIIFSTIIMAVTMELIVTRDPAISGLIFAFIAGCAVYLTCSLVLGTFEEEDFTLLASVKAILPGQKLKSCIDSIIAFISQFKHGSYVKKE